MLRLFKRIDSLIFIKRHYRIDTKVATHFITLLFLYILALFVQSASNRGIRRGNFVINPQWTSENVEAPPRSLGAVYEPAPQDFYGARALHAKTWEQAAIYPGHGINSHLASPG